MTFSERIDRITAQIEDEAKKGKPALVVAEKVAQKNGITQRDLSRIFTFMIGKSLIGYIKDRKLNAACEHLIYGKDNNPKSAKQYAITLSGLGDESALIKKCKDKYGLTPQKITSQKDDSLLTKRLCAESFFNTDTSDEPAEENGEKIVSDVVFGLNRKIYEEVKEAIELQELFGFDELQSGIAYNIYKIYDVPLKDAFRFVDEYEYTKEDEEKGERELKEFFGLPEDYRFAPEEEEIPRLTREEFYEEKVKRDANDPEIRYAFFDVGLSSVYAVYHLIDKLHALGDNDITELEPKLIEMCAYADFDARFCKKAVAYYLDNATDEYGDDAFDEYVGYLLNGQYIEDAFDNIWHTAGWDDYPYMSAEEYKREIEEYDPDDPFEKWAVEETDYSEKYRQ